MPHNQEIVDTSHAIEIADRIWWVGNYLEDDLFQCHSYLIEHGDQSVLIDPGSLLTFPATRAKIEEIIPFDNIRYFICHHQDPDITASLPLIDALITRDDAVIVSHWRAVALLRHYDLKTPFWNVEEHDWQLELGGRRLTFVLTPYLHFPGAFCTFDDHNNILFSSDIFGGFTEKWTLYAHDEGYLECMRAYHEHYMPSRDILQHSMEKFEKMEIHTIAPQHGSMIPKPLVKFMISRLKTMDCGLLMSSDQGESTRRLHEINQQLAESVSEIASSRSFGQVAEAFLLMISRIIPVRKLEFYFRISHDEQLYFAAGNAFHGVLMGINSTDQTMFNELEQLPAGRNGCKKVVRHLTGESAISVPLRIREGSGTVAVALLTVGMNASIDSKLLAALDQVSEPVAAALEREVIYLRMKQERNAMYEHSIRDGLTGLYRRNYMQSAAERMIHIHNRIPAATIGMIFIDVDRFKGVNDSHGHLVGDEVLRNCGRVIRETLRPMDIAVRFGGEEMLILTSSIDATNLKMLTERLRGNIHQVEIALESGGTLQVTVSAGTALHQQGESLECLIERADKALYQAKNSGRNQSCAAGEVALYI